MSNTSILSYPSPVGNLIIHTEDDYISSITFGSEEAITTDSDSKFIKGIRLELDQYFKRELKSFSLNIRPKGSEFQLNVWNELMKIPYGQTMSYKDLAIKLGDVNAVRAVALANAQNKIPIIIPCHRVIGSNGELTGYLGGLENKRKLLELEGAISKQHSLF